MVPGVIDFTGFSAQCGPCRVLGGCVVTVMTVEWLWQGSHMSQSAREVAAALGGLQVEEEEEEEEEEGEGGKEVAVKSVIGRVSMFETGDMAAGWDTERVVEVRTCLVLALVSFIAALPAELVSAGQECGAGAQIPSSEAS